MFYSQFAFSTGVLVVEINQLTIKRNGAKYEQAVTFDQVEKFSWHDKLLLIDRLTGVDFIYFLKADHAREVCELLTKAKDVMTMLNYRRD